MAKKEPVNQEALIPDEATPDMLVELIPKAQQIMKASAAYLAQVRKYMTQSTKKDYVAKWKDIDAITETIYDTADLAQKTLETGLAVETMLAKPLKSRELVMLSDLRRSLNPPEAEDDRN
ncbi:hypothetical protein [Bifidobacterium tissieri]|uniref:hypothetical protein n=1 Tax=Bifidobacterium tissieri TaxID=1630162 RepID=UPI001238EFAE|nr:hypothetical protein [Bifidobacterium tissieri]KAA8832587.1 hypothetical protein EM849_03515 [Bifidobacterium tissieri]